MSYRRLLALCMREMKQVQPVRNKMSLAAYKNPPNPMAGLTEREGLIAKKMTMDDTYCPLVSFEEYKAYYELKYNAVLYIGTVFFVITFYMMMVDGLSRINPTPHDKTLIIEPQYDAGHSPNDNGEGVIAQALENLGLK